MNRGKTTDVMTLLIETPGARVGRSWHEWTIWIVDDWRQRSCLLVSQDIYAVQRFVLLSDWTKGRLGTESRISSRLVLPPRTPQSQHGISRAVFSCHETVTRSRDLGFAP